MFTINTNSKPDLKVSKEIINKCKIKKINNSKLI